jgi:hypothetical protein
MKRFIIGLSFSLYGLIIYAQTNSFPSTGNVGIGTTNPIKLLDVQDSNTGTGETFVWIKKTISSVSAEREAGLLIGTNAGDFGNTFKIAAKSSNPYFSAPTLNFDFIQSSGQGTINLFTINSTGAIDIGALRLSSARVKSTSSNLHLDAGTGFTFLNYYDGEGVYFGNGSMTNTGAWLKNGNVGIGTITPNAKLDVFMSYNANINKGLKMFYQGSWGTAEYSSNFRFIDISSTEGGNILQVNGYGIGIGYAPPSHGSSNKLYINGNVGIGTNDPKAKLSVNGTIISTEIKVLADISQYPDFVFSDNYNLRSIKEVEKYIEDNNHLPDIPKAEEVKDGIALGEMNTKLLQKIEELTLYVIDLQKQVDDLKSQLNE